MHGGEMEDTLLGYEGRWVGSFTLHSTATGYSETFPVEQQYQWKNEMLHGIGVCQRKSGIESSRSVTYVEEGKLISEIQRGEETEMFLGVLHEGGVLWVPADLQRANDYQIKESLVEAEGQRILKTAGFDSYVYQDELAHIVYRGELIFQSE